VTGEPVVVPMLVLVACNRCRRERGAQLHATGSVEPIPESGTCPHGKALRRIWAEGYGPGSEPPEDSGWETRPDGPA